MGGLCQTSSTAMFSLLASLLVLGPAVHGPRLANFFQDGMVLQRAPEKATVYGFEELVPGTFAALSCSLKGRSLPLQYGLPVESEPTAEGDWVVELDPQEAGTVCDIQIVGGEEELSLKNVIFGDVWVCSGQSNMVFTMNGIFKNRGNSSSSSLYRYKTCCY